MSVTSVFRPCFLGWEDGRGGCPETVEKESPSLSNVNQLEMACTLQGRYVLAPDGGHIGECC